jgi:transcriptional regulator with XRE-family HTH domain
VSANFPNLPAAIAAYCSKSGQTQASLSRALKLSRATVTRWIQGDEPEVKRLKEIAKELGVSVGYLAADDEVAHNDDEIDLLKGYREQPERVKRLMRQLAREDDDSP